MLTTSRFALGLGLLLSLVLANERQTWAKEEFPSRISRALSAAADPPCSLCHQYGKTGGDTLVTPFALAMRARGMAGGGGSVDEALMRMAADAVDSDGDGAIDVDELTAGSDPNSAASTPTAGGHFQDPQLGCVMAGDDRQPTLWGTLLAAGFAGLLALGAARRRPRSLSDYTSFRRPGASPRPPDRR